MATVVERVTRLDEDANGIVLSPQEFDSIEDWDECFRYELVHGVVIVSPIPLEGEADPNEELGRMLGNYRERQPEGGALDRTLAEHPAVPVRVRRSSGRPSPRTPARRAAPRWSSE